jgi:hypothetical protein
MSNVIVGPGLGKLEWLATRIKDDIAKIEQSREDWVSTTLDLAAALAEAREHFKDNHSFSRWLEKNQFLISHQDRSALIAFGQDIERAKLILGQTESRSVRRIYDKEFRLTSAGKMKKSPVKKGLTVTPETQKALDAYDELKSMGVEPTQVEVEEKAGVSSTSVRRAFTITKTKEAILEVEPDLTGMPKSWASKYEAAVRRKVMQLEAEYDRRRMEQVQKHIEEYLMPFYRDKLAKAEQIMAIGKKPFTVDEYRQLLAALHPDSTVESRTKTFIMVKDREHLLRPPERDKPFTSSLPQTLEELLKRRKRH